MCTYIWKYIWKYNWKYNWSWIFFNWKHMTENIIHLIESIIHILHQLYANYMDKMCTYSCILLNPDSQMISELILCIGNTWSISPKNYGGRNIAPKLLLQNYCPCLASSGKRSPLAMDHGLHLLWHRNNTQQEF